MECEPKRKRPRFQFRLRTLIIGVTLFAVACGYVAWQARIVHKRKLVDDWITAHNGETAISLKMPGVADYQPSVSWFRRILGDRAVAGVNLSSPPSAEDEARIWAAFPEAEELRVEGSSLPRLRP
jgi:hypothetical protein